MTQPIQIRQQRPSDESGQSMLELALSLPVFVLLILGTAEIANIAWASVQLNNAAHAAAQYASQSRFNASTGNISNIELAAQNEAPKLTITFPTAPAQTCSCIDANTGAPVTGADCTTTDPNANGCASPDIILDSITVVAQAVVTPLIHYPGLPATYTLHAQATMGVVK